MTASVDEIIRISHDLDYEDVRSAITELEKVSRAKEKEAKKRAREELKATAAKYGMTLDELLDTGTGSRGKGATGGKLPPKFRHPETGKTWSGRGRRPKWIEAWEEQGGHIEELRIE